MEFDEQSAWLLSLPLYHVGGLAILMRALVANAAIILPGRSERLEDVLLREEPSHLSLVEAQLSRLVPTSETLAKLRRCRRIVMGGGPLSSAFAKYDLPIVASYGATEMASMWTATDPKMSFATQGSGALLAGRELKVSPKGELLVRGPLLGRYLDRALCDAEGYYHSGDLGHCDAQGNWHIVGRKDNMFISGGENIHPEEIERALRNHPFVQNAVVIGIPDAQWGERPIAFVESNEVIGEQALRAYLAELLPKFKIPDRFVPWCHTAQDGLKPKRAELRQKYLRNL
jgi:O-succinylbenzoic acid--CoA ligase